MKTVLSFLFLLLCFSGKANILDSTVNLKSVAVTSVRPPELNSGLKRQKLDTTFTSFLSKDLSSLLTFSPAYIRSYGPAQLALTSLRGGNAYHTIVEWNGFNINDPMSGLTDLTLIRNFLFEDINLQYGGNTSLSGSGAISGSVQLRSVNSFDRGFNFKILSAYNSTNTISNQISTSWSDKRWSLSLKAYSTNAKNEYRFVNENKKNASQKSAAYEQYGGMMEAKYITGKNSFLSVGYWHAYSHRNIPPVLYQSNSTAIQNDNFHRITSEWKYAKSNFNLSVGSAYFYQYVMYDDRSLQEKSIGKSHSFMNEISPEYIFRNHHFTLIIGEYITNASTADYGSSAQLNRFTSALLYRFIPNEKVNFSLSARKEITSLNDAPVVVNGGINFSPLKNFTLRASGATVHRNPSFNDLYWNPGGNKNLNPEKGYSYEAGINYSGKIKKQLSLNADITFFNKRISDWIQWRPSNSFYAPVNISDGHSYGIEGSFEINYKLSNLQLSFRNNLTFLNSINKKAENAYDQSAGKQLIYVPHLQSNSFFGITFRRISLLYRLSYSSERFTLTDNSASLDPFYLHDLTLQINYNKHWSFYISCENITNTNYQLMQNRPMPLRTFETGLTYQLK